LKNFALSLVAVAYVLSVPFVSCSWGKTILVRVNARNYQELYDHIPFKGTTIDIAGAKPGQTYDLTLDESDLGLVRSCGLQSQVIAPDLDYWQSLEGSFGYYQSFDSMMSTVKHLAANYSSICALESIGPSYESRWIYGLKITQNPQVEDSMKPEIIIYAQIHAREWGAGQMARHIMDTLVRNYASNPGFQNWINSHQLWIFPIFNCDGFSYDYPGQVMWRKNREPYGGAIGTDMNRNGGGLCNGDPQAEWGALVSGSRTSHYPDDETFMGPKALWTPELQGLIGLFKQHNFIEELSIHSYSELVLWSYGHGPQTPDNAFISRISTGTANLIGALGGGTYTPEQSVTLYPTNGDIEDWFYAWSRAIGGHPCFDLEYECGTTFYQPTSNLDGMATQIFKGTWYWLNHADTVLTQMTPLVPRPFVAAMDTSDDGNYTVSWTPLKPRYSHPDKWELEELQDLAVTTEDVEGATSAWTLQGATVSTAQHHGGAKSFFLGNTSNMDNWVVTVDPYPVTSASDSLTFWVYYNLETNYDVGTAEVSLEGKDWVQLDNAYTGTSGWVRKAYSLAPWLGKSVFIRLRAMSDDGSNSGGMYVDDIYPKPVFATHTTISSTLTDTLYEFTSKPVGHYWYRVRGHNTAWNWGDKGPLEDVVVTATGVASPGALPPAPETRLGAASPNPFSDRTLVNYALGRTGRVKLSIYDPSGKLVRQLVGATQNPSNYSVLWDGRDMTGHKLANGIYVLRLEADRTVTQQILMLH
jgi:carboxypeptidase T